MPTTADTGPGPQERARTRAADRLLAATIARGGRWLALDVAARGAGAVVTLLVPAAVAAAVDAAVSGAGTGRALTTLAFVVGAGVVATVLGELATPYGLAASTVWLRTRLLRRVLHLGPAATRAFGPGDLTARIGTNSSVTAVSGPVLLSSAVGLLTSVGGVVALFWVDPLVGAVFLVGVPVALVLVKRFVGTSSEVYADYQHHQGRLAERLVDALAGVRTIRSAGTADREVERVLAPLGDLAVAGRATWALQARVTWRVQLLVPLMEVLTLAVAGYRLTTGDVSPGELLAVAAYVTLALTFVDQANLLIALASARAAARRTHEVLAGSPHPPPAGDAVLPPGAGELVLRGIRTARMRPDAAALDLTVAAGTGVAVVGTLAPEVAAVVGGLEAPEAGSVHLDGVALAELDPVALRDGVGWAFERPVLIGATVRDAIAYGGTRPERVPEAARAADADGFVGRLPEGYDTPLGSAPLSGGERQRLGLARALHRNSRVLVLDDATSSLDTATEARVAGALRTALRGRTRVQVARRATTAADADEVLWVDEHGVRGRAPHAVLWQDPDYRAVFAADGPEDTR